VAKTAWITATGFLDTESPSPDATNSERNDTNNAHRISVEKTTITRWSVYGHVHWSTTAWLERDNQYAHCRDLQIGHLHSNWISNRALRFEPSLESNRPYIPLNITNLRTSHLCSNRIRIKRDVWKYRFLIPILKHIKQYWRMLTHTARESVYCTTKRH